MAHLLEAFPNSVSLSLPRSTQFAEPATIGSMLADEDRPVRLRHECQQCALAQLGPLPQGLRDYDLTSRGKLSLKGLTGDFASTHYDTSHAGH